MYPTYQELQLRRAAGAPWPTSLRDGGVSRLPVAAELAQVQRASGLRDGTLPLLETRFLQDAIWRTWISQ